MPPTEESHDSKQAGILCAPFPELSWQSVRCQALIYISDRSTINQLHHPAGINVDYESHTMD
ncbi:hypothetical protein EJB05_30473, partial [Eragrostis curvula]